MRTFSWTWIILLLHLLPPLAMAQGTTSIGDNPLMAMDGQVEPTEIGPSEPETSEDKSCFRSQRCPRCKGSYLLEVGIAHSSKHCGKLPWLSTELGYLWNLGPDYGLGGKFFVGGDDCGARVGFRAVGRWWVNSQLSFEVGPGIVFAGSDYQAFPSFSLQLALDVAGLIAPVYNLELIRQNEPSRWKWEPDQESLAYWESFFGVRVSSYGAPVGLLLILIGAAASQGYHSY